MLLSKPSCRLPAGDEHCARRKEASTQGSRAIGRVSGRSMFL